MTYSLQTEKRYNAVGFLKDFVALSLSLSLSLSHSLSASTHGSLLVRCTSGDGRKRAALAECFLTSLLRCLGPGVIMGIALLRFLIMPKCRPQIRSDNFVLQMRGFKVLFPLLSPVRLNFIRSICAHRNVFLVDKSSSFKTLHDYAVQCETALRLCGICCCCCFSVKPFKFRHLSIRGRWARCSRAISGLSTSPNRTT